TSANSAFAQWSQSSLEQRLGVLRQLHEQLETRADEIADVICREVGMPLKLAHQIQAGLPAVITKSYLKILPEFPFTETVANSEIQYAPVGVVGCVTPWNYPLHQVILKVVPALAAGCTV